MRFSVMILMLIASCGAHQSAMATERSDQATPQRGPATGPMTTQEAASRWDGTGELLLLPPAEGVGLPGLTKSFTIGATFDNSDAPRPEIDAPRSAFQRCPSGIYPIRLARGSLVFISPFGTRWRQAPRISSSLDPDAIGSLMATVETDRCRYTLSVRVKLHGQDGWTSMPRYVPAPPFIGETITLKPGETITVKAPPTPAEFSIATMATKIGPYVPPELARNCPNIPGSLWFEPQGVYVDIPWNTNDLVVPGLRRDTEARATTLIFQNPECRLELSVRRDIQDGDGWHASPLSTFPATGSGE